MDDNGKNLRIWQAKFLAAAAVLFPVSPILYLQGHLTRRKVGVLPDAGGDKFGLVGTDASPVKLLVILREKSPGAVIFLANCAMIKYSPVIPQPVKGILWQLSKMHDANIAEFTGGMERVFYYPQPAGVRLEGFFADGIHASEQGYA